MFDLKIVGGQVLDGTGKLRYRADVGVEGDKITAIGDLSGAEAKKVVDATGKFVSPGFFDFHTHSDYSLLYDQRVPSRIYSGVTTDVIGNCGIGLAPIRDSRKDELVKYLQTRIVGTIHAPLILEWNTVDEYFKYIEKDPPAVNVVSYLAHGPVRIDEIGFRNGPATPEEVSHMQAEVAKAMEAGAIGLTSGLIYMPGAYTGKEELAELCRAMAPYGGYYCTHMRDEGDTVLDALEEAIYIASKGGVPLHVSHLKVMGAANFGKIDQVFDRIHKAQAEGLEVTYDCYPYTAGMTSLGALLPPWMFEGGVDNMLKRLEDPKIRKKSTHDILNGVEGWQDFYLMCGNFGNITIASVFRDENKSFEGRTVEELAKETGKDGFDFCYDLLKAENGKVQINVEVMCQSDVDKVVCDPETMIGSDSADFATDGILNFGQPHPRAFGTVGRIFSHYVRETGMLTFEQAVRKMTSLPAKRVGMADTRGLIKEGYFADITVFDPKTIADKATYQTPKQYTVGVEAVVVNGKLALENGKQLDEVHAGRMLRKHH